MSVPVSRRNFLLRTGVLAATAAVGQLGLRPKVLAQPAEEILGPALEALNPVLQQLAYDTVGGICVFVVPGGDEYSQAQGVTDPRPGPIEADAIRFMLQSLDNFLPLPDTVARALVQSFATSTSEIPIPPELQGVLDELLGGLYGGAAELDDVLLELLENDQAVPTSLVIAMYLNFAASLTNPASLAGTFVSPFANLSFAEKGAAFEIVEVDHAELFAMVDSGLSEPLRESVSGLLRFVPGAILEFAAFGTYGEFGVFDRDNPMRLRGRPVGWELSGYMEGRLEPVHGWDELIGYHKNVRSVEGSWDQG